ncbi:MAG: FtsQ-type POTRA domain-containing protein [Lentisphaeria bacterium]|nr:FtsQ-type POTRA domain-containing protein [Lentisphaeria bacterium]
MSNSKVTPAFSEQTSEEQRLARRKKWRAFAVLLLFLFVTTGLVFLLFSLRKAFFNANAHFKLKQLEIINGSFWKGKEKALSSRAGIYPGVNLFNLNYVLLRKRIESIPGIEKAEVVRILPDKLQIKVVERIPRAVLFIPSGAYVVDENGIVIPRAESAVHGSLPVITTIPGRRSFKLGECLDTLQPSLELIMTVLRNFPDIDIECVMPGSKEELNFYMRYRSGKRYLVTLPLNNSKNLPYLLSALQTTIINIHWKQVNISHINLLYNGRVVLK